MPNLIHVGTELIVIFGITFWLNKKINNTNEELQFLKQKVFKMEESFAKIMQMLQTPRIQPQQQPRQRVRSPPPQDDEEDDESVIQSALEEDDEEVDEELKKKPKNVKKNVTFDL